MRRSNPNELSPDHLATRRMPSQSTGFAISQEMQRHGGPSEIDKLIDALGTHNVIGRTFSFWADTVAAPILNANRKRVGLSIQNISGGDVYIGIGTQPSLVGATATNGLLIQNGGFYEPMNNYIATNDIFVLGTATGLQLVVIELTKL